MVNLSTFSGSRLDKNQMKDVVGGQEQASFVQCRTAGGGYRTLMLDGPFNEDEMALAIDNYNSSQGFPGNEIVGCEVPD